jgi:hypothetical protein
MAAEINRTWIINIYAPSGAEKRTERGRLFTNDVPVLMPPACRDMILAGDFNSTIDKHDSISQNTSKALATLIRGCDLCDTAHNRTGYAYYASNTASRIDRIYVTARLYSTKTGVEHVAAAFTDHLAVVLRLAIDAPLPIRGRGYWKMNSYLLQSEALGKGIHDQWHTWQQKKRHYNKCHMVGTIREKDATTILHQRRDATTALHQRWNQP